MIQAPVKAKRGKHAANRSLLSGSPVWPILTAIIGVAFLLYPVFATQYNDIQHRENAREYSVAIEETDPVILDKELVEAEAYNEEHAGGIVLDPYLTAVRHMSPDYAHYLQQLDLLPAMASVVIPKINVNLPIYHGTDEDTLKEGVGHLFGSSLPVGGVGSHSVVTGHTGLGDATLFNNVKKLVTGDSFFIDVQGRKLKYEVVEINVVEPNDPSLLANQPGRDLVTLITCTPYGVNSHRLLVMAERVPFVEEEAAEEILKPQEIKPVWEWWMYALVAAAILGFIIVVGFILYWVRVSRMASSGGGRHHVKARR